MKKYWEIKAHIQHLLGWHKDCKKKNRYPGWCLPCLKSIVSPTLSKK